MYHDLYSEAVVSSIASVAALAEVGQFKKAAQYLQKAAKTLYEAARDVFEHVKVAVQRLVELFVEAVAQVLALVDEHKAYPYLMAAGAVALSIALNLCGAIELEKLAHFAMGVPPFVAAGVKADERKVAEVVRLAEGALGKTPTLGPGGVVLAEVERWLAGLRSGEVKTAVARAAEELEKWLGAVKNGRYADYSSGRAAKICAGGVQYDALAASARRGVLTAARVGDVARLWKAYVDGVESYLTDPAKQEELRREAERWIKA
jgi:hypothetical protein